MEDYGSPMSITYMPITPCFSKNGERQLGEIDVFTLSELPVKRLQKLQKCPLENFSKVFANILREIAKNLADRLSKDSNYRVILLEAIEDAGDLTHDEACGLWASLVFRKAILDVWDNVPTSKKLFRQFTERFLENQTQKQDDELIYLYAILAYARTIVKQKGSSRKWKKLRPHYTDL